MSRLSRLGDSLAHVVRKSIYGFLTAENTEHTESIFFSVYSVISVVNTLVQVLFDYQFISSNGSARLSPPRVIVCAEWFGSFSSDLQFRILTQSHQAHNEEKRRFRVCGGISYWSKRA
jgi:hypothetical protein